MTSGTAAPVTSEREFLVAAAAANLAGWHDLHVRALGFATEWRDGLWLTPDPVPAIFFHAIAVRPGASAATVGERVARHRWASVSDPWADLPMPAQGYALDGDHAWMVRQPGRDRRSPAPPPDAGATPAALVIEQVREPTAWPISSGLPRWASVPAPSRPSRGTRRSCWPTRACRSGAAGWMARRWPSRWASPTRVCWASTA